MEETERKELFYYDFLDCRCTSRPDFETCLVSEVKLPAPPRNFLGLRKFSGICCMYLPRIPLTVKVGDVVDIAYGDPIILKGCRLLARGNRETVPAEVISALGVNGFGTEILTFEYKGGKIWTIAHQVCLLSELEKKANG